MKKVLKWVAIVVVALFVIGGIGAILDPAEDETAGGAATTETTTAPPPPPTATAPATPVAQATARQKLEKALPDGAEVTGAADFVVVFAKTPEGGLNGPSTADLDRAAAGIFKAIHHEAGYSRPSRVVFRGGLVDSRTGKDSDALTGRYSMSAEDAQQVDWTVDDIEFRINWELFRDFAHPALRDS